MFSVCFSGLGCFGFREFLQINVLRPEGFRDFGLQGF